MQIEVFRDNVGFILAIGHDVLLFHAASIGHLRSKKVYAISLIKR